MRRPVPALLLSLLILIIVFSNCKTDRPLKRELLKIWNEDQDNVDKRRKSVGLEPLGEYLKQWNITWNAEEYKKELPGLEKIYKEKKPDKD